MPKNSQRYGGFEILKLTEALLLLGSDTGVQHPSAMDLEKFQVLNKSHLNPLTPESSTQQPGQTQCIQTKI
jgi:hypothetical protein